MYIFIHGIQFPDFLQMYCTKVFLLLQGARIWIPDPDHIWRAAELLEDYKGQNKIKIQYEEGEVSLVSNRAKSGDHFESKTMFQK